MERGSLWGVFIAAISGIDTLLQARHLPFGYYYSVFTVFILGLRLHFRRVLIRSILVVICKPAGVVIKTAQSSLNVLDRQIC